MNLDARIENALAIASSSLIFVSTAFFVLRWRRRPSQSKDAKALYHDEDGTATPESQSKYSTRIQKATILLFSVVGSGVSLGGAIITALAFKSDVWRLVQTWLSVLSWLCITVHAIGLQFERRPVQIFNDGAQLLLLSVLVLIVQVVDILSRDVRHGDSIIWSPSTQIACSLMTSIAASLIPRRPVVYYRGHEVDGEHTSSIFYRFSFTWATLILKRGVDKGGRFSETDLPNIDRARRAEKLEQTFYEMKKSPKLYVQLVKTHWGAFAACFSLSVFESLLTFTPPVFMNQLLRYLERRTAGENVGNEGWLWVCGMALAKFGSAVLFSYVNWIIFSRLQIPIRSQLSTLVFSKTMRKKDVKGVQKEDAKKDAKKDIEAGSTKGKVSADADEEEDELKNMQQGTINLLAVDSDRVSVFAAFSYIFMSSLAEMIFGFTFLILIMGWKSLLAGLAAIVLSTPLNSYFSKRYSIAQDELMKIRDRKMAVVSEALQGIRQIKFSALEDRWEARIRKVRDEEIKTLRAVFMADVAMLAAWIMTPVFLSAVALSTYALINRELTPAVAFPALALFGELEWTLSVVPELITDLFDALVSVRRIQKYLDSAEKTAYIVESDKIALTNAAVAWAADSDSEEDRFSLRDITLDFPRNELSVISGRTGSGKSLLLSALLGEADLLSGKIEMPRAPPSEERFDSKAVAGNWIIPSAVAFVAQIPWIEDGSIRSNILFGLPHDERRYRRTIAACALDKDLEMLPDADLTEIGANGVNLSGGQRWRVSLARAIYSRAGILIMDDIFSAVDAHVGKHIFENALTGSITRNRTRILVTHHLKLCINSTKYAVSLTNGSIESAGLIEDLQERGILEKLIAKEEAIDEEEEVEDVETGLERIRTRDSAVSRRKLSMNGVNGVTQEPTKKPRQFVKEEDRETGAVSKAIYITYLKASGGYWYWLFLLLVFGGQELLVVGRTFWIKLWTSNYETQAAAVAAQIKLQHVWQYSLQTFQKVTQEQPNLAYYIGIYIALSIGVVLFGVLKYVFIFIASLKASRKLFEDMTKVILRTPMRWLDTVPTGRILNRFSKDFETVDSKLANDVAFFLYNALGLIAIHATGIAVSPYVLIIAAVFLYIDYRYAVYYLTGAREVKRLESNSRSPIFELFGAALTGVATIRGFGRSKEYIKTMHEKLDIYSQRTFYMWLFNRWVGLRMSIIGAGFLLIISCALIILPDIDASMAGFVLSFTLSYNVTVIWVLRRYANTELDMNSTERIIEYTQLDTEDQGGMAPPAAWPYEGKVEFKELYVGYAPDLPPVLKGLSFEVQPRERVGIVGRTGAGKSSLTLALFQFIRASSGTITIDGLDISKINLHELRSRIAIIPQDPVLFSGTIRSNLDAFNEYTDQELRDALARVHLVSSSEQTSGSSTPTANENANIFNSLDSKVSEGGLNLSQGQRQLLCLARAIVSRPKILVLDEATSAVDMTTDALIQTTIREEFTDCTSLTIAHRLNTVMEMSRILVLGDGKVLEYDTPWNLIQAKGVLYDMVQQSGESETLEAMAKAGAPTTTTTVAS